MALWSVPHATLLLLLHPGIFQARLLWGMELLPSWDSLLLLNPIMPRLCDFHHRFLGLQGQMVYSLWYQARSLHFVLEKCGAIKCFSRDDIWSVWALEESVSSGKDTFRVTCMVPFLTISAPVLESGIPMGNSISVIGQFEGILIQRLSSKIAKI